MKKYRRSVRKNVSNENNPKYNESHYLDLTAYEAIRRMEESEIESTERFNKTLHILKSICDIAGFNIENRIILKDKRTGRVWR